MNITRVTLYGLFLITSALIVGCGQPFMERQPFSGWCSLGSKPHFYHSPNKTITDDYENYIRLNTIPLSDIREIIFFEDGTGHGDTTGRHAVEIIQQIHGDNFNDRRPDRCYFIEYDKSDVRTKARIFSWKSYNLQ